jgi:ABC-2 type transport system permease protein
MERKWWTLVAVCTAIFMLLLDITVVNVALPQIASGLFVSTFGFGVGLLLLNFHLGWSQIPPLALVLVVTVSSCTSFGLLLGSIGLRARDVFFISNLVYFLMLLFCGVNIPLDDLPGWMAAIGRGLPLTHGIEAAREIARGAPLGDVGGLIATEAAIGVVYAAVAFGLFRYFEYEGRRRASFETM